jgi:hypothetical protein
MVSAHAPGRWVTGVNTAPSPGPGEVLLPYACALREHALGLIGHSVQLGTRPARLSARPACAVPPRRWRRDPASGAAAAGLLDAAEVPDGPSGGRQPALRDRPQRKLLSRERRVHIDQLPAFIADSEERIRAQLRAAGLAGDGRVLVYFHGYVTRDSDGPAEAAVPFTGSVEPIDDLRGLSPPDTDAFVPVAGADAQFPGS